MQHTKTMRHGIARNVGPPNVQKPVQTVGQGDHGARVSRILEGLTKAATLGGMAFAGKLKRMHFCRLHRRVGLVRPHRIDQIGAGHQFNAAAAQSLAGLFNLSRRMQPCVKPDTGPLRYLFQQPLAQ